MVIVVAALEVLGLLLLAAGAAVAVAGLVGLWAGLLAAGVVVLAGAARADMLLTGGSRAAVRTSERLS